LSDIASKLSWTDAYDWHYATKTIVQTRRQRSFQYHEYAGRTLSRREQSLAAAVFPVFSEPLDAQNIGLAEHGQELILASRKVARERRQKGLDFSCHLSANCSNAPHVDRGVSISGPILGIEWLVPTRLLITSFSNAS
jgi:hypothetical protein